MQHDIVADALSALKNARRIGKENVAIKPTSKLIFEILKVMQKEGYIGNFEVVEAKKGEMIVEIRKELNNCNIIKPRHYVGKDDFIKFEKRYLPARSMGLIVVSTSQGVMSHKKAVEKGIGGSLIAYVY